MLRAGKRAASIKPNRKLDKRSSRGMLFENEELRLRTMNINAEVEKGQHDNRKLRRENDNLRRELWAMRERVEHLAVLRRGRADVLEDEQDEDDEDREETSYEDHEEEEEGETSNTEGDRPSLENMENLHKDFSGLNPLQEDPGEALAAAADSGKPIPPPERTVHIVLPEESSHREDSPEPLPYPFPFPSTSGQQKQQQQRQSPQQPCEAVNATTSTDETTTSGSSAWDASRLSGLPSRDSSGSSSLGLGCERYETVVRRRSSPGPCPLAPGYQRRSSVRSENGSTGHSCQRCVNFVPRKNSCVLLGASEPDLNMWRGGDMVAEASGALSIFSSRDELLRLHCVEPHTLTFHLAHLPSALSDLTASEVIDELHRQLGGLTEVTGVRVAAGVCYVSFNSESCLRTLLECGLCLRGVSVPLEDASTPCTVLLALGGVPSQLSDKAITSLIAPLGTIEGPVEHRVYRGVDTGERMLRLKPSGGLDYLHLPSYLNLGGYRILLRVVSPAEAPRSFDSFWRTPALVHEAVQTDDTPEVPPPQDAGVKIGKSFGLRNSVNAKLQVPSGSTPAASPTRTEPPRLHHTLSAMPLLGSQSREGYPGHAPLQRAVSASHHQLSPTTTIVATPTTATPASASTPRTSVNFDARLPGRQPPQASRSASPVVNGILRKHVDDGSDDAGASRQSRPRSKILSRSFSLDPSKVLGVGPDNKRKASRVDSSSTTTPSTPVEDPDGLRRDLDRVSVASKGSSAKRHSTSKQINKDIRLPWCACWSASHV